MLTGCLAYQIKATNDFGASNLEKAVASVVVIRTEGLIKGEIDKFIIKAIAVPIGNGLVVALKHATEVLPYKRVWTPIGIYTKPRVVLKTKWFIGKTEIKLIGRKDDISLFKTNIPAFPFEFGDSERLRLGDKVALIGYPYLKAVCVKVGVVAKPKFGEVMNYKVPAVLISVSANPGDSGSPVLAYQDGTLKIVAIQAAKFGNNGIAVAYRANYVQKCLSEIRSK